MSRITCCLLAILLVGHVARAEPPADPSGGRTISRPASLAKPLSPATSGGIYSASNAWPLLFVVGLIAGGAWLARQRGWMGGTNAAPGPLQVLARVPLDARCAMLVVRCGERLLILGTSPAGVTALSEIQSPEEVQSLAEQCVAPATNPLTERLSHYWSRPVAQGEAT
ncbi:MAG: flagellar biosynthetic protein FliO [Planctomycetota bacterium]|nr:flagellar biosynthetic protein FliO [Planctomycetota bacterium]